MKLQERTKVNESISLLWIVLSVISTISILSHLILNSSKEYSYVFNVKSIILSVILTSVLIFFILEKQIKRGDFPYFNLIIIGSYILSLPLILSAKGSEGYHIWLIGSLIVSAIINVNLGFIVLFHHVFLASLLGNYNTEQVIYLLIFGVVACILSKHMKKRNLLKYIIMIVVFLDLILQFVINDFLINNMQKKEVLIAIILDVIMVLTTYMICSYYVKKVYNSTNRIYQKEEHKISTLDGQVVNLVNNNREHMNAMRTTDANMNSELLDEIINPDFILLQQLNRYSSNLYDRSVKVGKISFLAAKEIGANEKLALAGGLYHDIGRMIKGDYVEEGLKLVKKYNMPREIGDMINQHNIKYDTPKSPEAAIIMLTVSIIATKDILVNSGKMHSDMKDSMSMKKIVENVFDMRLSKHSLDESGLTIQQFNQLKAFYTTNIL